MKTLTLQLFNRGQWWDAVEVTFAGDSISDGVTFAYRRDYIADSPAYEAKDCWACTVNAPISIVPVDYPHWPSVFDDMIPAGQSRAWWVNYLNVSRAGEFIQNYTLLSDACMAPVGNVRVKEAAARLPQSADRRFSIDEVVQLQYEFLEYANEQGAAVGGATGAVGVAPKLLLMVEARQVYIDGDFAGKPLTATPYLTKFARNTRSERDNNILKAEGAFYRVLSNLLHDTIIDTLDTDAMMLLEHNGQASLWLPRFDIEIRQGIAHRLGLESIYSMLNAAPGSYQDHFSVIDGVWQRIQDSTSMSSEDFVQQYVSRDLLNLVFGNSDNHGRNVSFLKHEGDIQFAPVYDFAPMKADPEMITRLFKWGKGCESSGVVHFDKVATELSGLCSPEVLLSFLEALAAQLTDLPAELKKQGCPQEIINFSSIGFHNTRQKLTQMGVLLD